MLDPLLGTDRVFGRMNGLQLEDYFDYAKLDQMRQAVRLRSRSPRPPSGSRRAGSSPGTPEPLRTGDLDPDRPAARLDRSCDLSPGAAELLWRILLSKARSPAVPRHPAPMPGQGTCRRTRGPAAPARLAARPPGPYPSNQRTRPSRAALATGIARTTGRTHRMHARLSGARQARTRCQCGLSVAVRGKPTATPTARPARSPSAIRPWTPQHDGLQCNKMTHHATEKERPANARIRSQLAVSSGGGRCWVRTHVG